MRIQFDIGVPDGLVRVVKALSRKSVVWTVVVSSVVLGSLTAVSLTAIADFTPFVDGNTMSAESINKAIKPLYDTVASLQAAQPADNPLWAVNHVGATSACVALMTPGSSPAQLAVLPKEAD